jgi:hypothetical protein
MQCSCILLYVYLLKRSSISYGFYEAKVIEIYSLFNYIELLVVFHHHLRLIILVQVQQLRQLGNGSYTQKNGMNHHF